jgi:hypothetical protein
VGDRRLGDSSRRRRLRLSLGAVAAVAIVATAVALVPLGSDKSANGQSDGAEAGKARRAAPRCDRTAGSASGLSSALRAARPGRTVCLASGSYGTFHGGAKAGPVTVRAQPGASASLALDLNGAKNMRIQGLTITEGFITGGSRNLTIAHNRFTGNLIIDQRTPHPNIVLDHNTHNNIPGNADDYTSRVHLDAPGVVVKNSLFSGGTSDGIRVGNAPHTKILRNEFTAFVDVDPLHSDPIQFYGEGPRTTIRGNWFHDMVAVSSIIMMADGGGPNLIEDNLFGPGGGHAYALTWYSDDSSIIRHNTFLDDKCNFNLRCGIINLGYKPGDDAGRGTLIEDNILTSIGTSGNGEGGGRSTFSSNHNLLRRQRPIGPGDIRGAPKYVGRLTSANAGRSKAFAQYRLRRGSRGRGNASDGTDRGIR